MDMEADPAIVEMFESTGLSEPTEFLKIESIIRDLKLDIQTVHIQWDLYLIKNKVDENHGAHLDRFKNHLRKELPKLRKSTVNKVDKNLAKMIERDADFDFDTNPESTVKTYIPPPSDNVVYVKKEQDVEMTDDTNNNNHQNGNGNEDYSDALKNEQMMEDDDILDPFTFEDFNTPMSTEDKQKRRIAMKMIRLSSVKNEDIVKQTFSTRQNSGKVVQEYNTDKVKIPPKEKNVSTISMDIEIMSSPSSGGEMPSSDELKYMSETLEGRNKLLGASVASYRDQFDVPPLVDGNNNNSLSDEETQRCIGRVWLDKFGISLTRQFKLLGSGGVDQPKFSSYSLAKKDVQLYTGQVVMVQGKKVPGQHFHCSDLFFPKPLKQLENRQTKDNSYYCITASGPYSECTNNEYNPLTELLKVIDNKKPNLVILNGPFVDDNNVNLKYSTISFQDMFDSLMEKLSRYSFTKFIVVPSVSDAHHDIVFPQPPLQTNKKYTNIIYAPNPATILIDNSITIGLSNSNIVGQLELKYEYLKNGTKDYTPICESIIRQQCYYPLHPAEMPLDMTLLDHLKFPQITPDIMIFGETEVPFVCVAENVLCISSGRLIHKSYISGNYSEFVIVPPSSVDQQSQSIADRTIVFTTNI